MKKVAGVVCLDRAESGTLNRLCLPCALTGIKKSV